MQFPIDRKTLHIFKKVFIYIIFFILIFAQLCVYFGVYDDNDAKNQNYKRYCKWSQYYNIVNKSYDFSINFHASQIYYDFPDAIECPKFSFENICSCTRGGFTCVYSENLELRNTHVFYFNLRAASERAPAREHQNSWRSSRTLKNILFLS